MIYFLQGVVHSKRNSTLILLVHDVGYGVSVPSSLLQNVHIGSKLELFIHSHIREDTFSLFGFKTESQLNLFSLLLGVSGIGPKTALTIVERGEKEIHQAIMSADIDFFTGIPRLGKKNAQKIIIDLKSKLATFDNDDLTKITSTEDVDTIRALKELGFTHSEVLQALKALPKEAKTLEQKIRQALKLLHHT